MYVSISISIYIYIYLSLSICIHTYICLPVYLSIYQSIHIFICIYVYMYIMYLCIHVYYVYPYLYYIWHVRTIYFFFSICSPCIRIIGVCRSAMGVTSGCDLLLRQSSDKTVVGICRPAGCRRWEDGGGEAYSSSSLLLASLELSDTKVCEP